MTTDREFILQRIERKRQAKDLISQAVAAIKRDLQNNRAVNWQDMTMEHEVLLDLGIRTWVGDVLCFMRVDVDDPLPSPEQFLHECTLRLSLRGEALQTLRSFEEKQR